MKIVKKATAMILVALVFCLSIVSASADTANNEQPDTSAANYRIPAGSFVQDYMTASWSDERWQQELTAMKEAGMEYLIFSPSVIKNMGTGEAHTIYPTQIPELKDGYYGDDRIDDCLRNCEKAGMKVFITLNQDPEMKIKNCFWTFGWKISGTKPEDYIEYWKNNTELSNKIADELYSMYKSKYKNAFYGWYWVHEFWNYSICTRAYENQAPGDYTAEDPTVYTDIIATKAFNPVLEHLTTLDSSMPMLFSSFSNPVISEPESVTKFWTDIIKKTNFREGDIWAPMDGMGGGVLTLDELETWTAATYKASETNKNLHFWINNEEQIVYCDKGGNLIRPMDDEVSLIDRVVKQIEITSKYAEQNVFFTWNHYFSPYNAVPGYNQTYMQYINTGKIEKNAPSAVDANTIKVSKINDQMYKTSWEEPTDDVGIAVYNIYENNKLAAHLHPNRKDSTGAKPTMPHSWKASKPGNYEIEAIDFAGNVSPRTKFTIENITPTTTTTKTSTNKPTDSTTVSTQTTNSTDTTVSTINNKKSNNPHTGYSSLPISAVILAAASVGVGLIVKSKKSK